MRSLSKTPKVKQNVATKQQLKEQSDKKNQKSQSKKILKTTFINPFRYKIQALNVQDGFEIINILINYAQQIRNQQGTKTIKMQNEKFISFNSKVRHQKPPLTTDKLIYGINNCTKKIKNNKNIIKTIVFFYDQNKHEAFEQLMCLVLYNQISYLITRDSQNLRKELGVKRMMALGLTCQKLSNSLLKYSSRNLLQIPWLVDKNWIPLQKNIQK